MTAIVEIPTGHFSGQRATTSKPGGEDQRSLEDLIRELQEAANAGSLSALDCEQDVASTEAHKYVAPGAGEIVSVVGVASTAVAAVGEDMTCNVLINGTTVLLVPLVIDDTSGSSPVVGSMKVLPQTFAQGDIITIGKIYTPGGGATPMQGVLLAVGLRLSE